MKLFVNRYPSRRLAVLSSKVNGNIHQMVVGERQTLSFHTLMSVFISSIYYFTILARGNAMFFVYFEQNAPRLNLYIFFSVFFSDKSKGTHKTLHVAKSGTKI